MHFGAQLRGLRAPCERFAPWVTPGPRITRFRLAADLGRMGLDTHRVSNKVSKITSRHLVPLDRAFPAHALVHGSRALGEPRSTSWPSWRQQVHDLDMKSRVHPKYKTKYHVGNWPAYDRALVQRGDITVWLAPDAIAAWEAVGVGKRGGQLQYSDLAIETALTLRLIFHLPRRQTEGFLTSIFGMLLLVAAVAFGAAHVAGGTAYVLLATLAGISYGAAYHLTGRVEASILVHFTLNVAHLVLFTYPFAA